MVFGKPWDENMYKPDNDFFEKLNHDDTFRNTMAHLTSIGTCKVLPTVILGGLGFGLGGVLGGSCAAAWQAILGNVPAGSMFAFLQSAGAGGKAALTLQAMCDAYGQYAAGTLAGAVEVASQLGKTG